MSLSATFSSISIDSSTGENDDSNLVDESPVLIEETTSQSTIEILRAKIESLSIENAELRESKGHATKNYESLQEEMRRQSTIIEELRRELDCGVSEGGD
jgi:predicted  nucleic acid-binding Zn-ribbon protein